MRPPEVTAAKAKRAPPLPANKPDYGDSFDYPDIPPANGLSEANYKAVMPDNVRKRIAERDRG